jgi:hypothetical protein
MHLLLLERTTNCKSSSRELASGAKTELADGHQRETTFCPKTGHCIYCPSIYGFTPLVSNFLRHVNWLFIPQTMHFLCIPFLILSLLLIKSDVPLC